MFKYSNLVVHEEEIIKSALIKMDEGGEGLLVVTSSLGVVVGIVADGDVRRALIKGVSLEASVGQIMNRAFKFWSADQPREAAVGYLMDLNCRYLPVLDDQKRLLDIIFSDHPGVIKRDNPVIIMAGGLGMRLRPLTENVPKPMLTVDGQPFLEIILKNFVNQGFSNFYFCVNYLADQIFEHFGDGEKWGVRINYVHEKIRMGTAGAISLIDSPGALPAIVMNGDLVTNVDFNAMLSFHESNSLTATMAVRQMEFQIPFGVVEAEHGRIISIIEKPIQRFLVNAGIYVVNTDAFDLIPRNEFYDMPDFIDQVSRLHLPVGCFPLYESWIDVGGREDYDMVAGGKLKK